MTAVTPTATEAAEPYPVTVDGTLDEPLSQWLWLVKWFLAIPHYVVLFFLTIAFILTTIVAFFSIVFTGRYPRELFNFNVGVMRWWWRVDFYALAAIGTDRYPPFTLADVDYPCRLEVPYPEQLSRWKPLVKSWLFAFPHWIAIGAFTGGIWLFSSSSDWHLGISLNTLLVLVAGFTLLFRGRYPRDVFELLIGINRWVYRVIAYAALMRDEYPPFRLGP
jgi:uncharacterized protein DUF4389